MIMANYKLLTSKYQTERREDLSFKQHKICKYLYYKYKTLLVYFISILYFKSIY